MGVNGNALVAGIRVARPFLLLFERIVRLRHIIIGFTLHHGCSRIPLLYHMRQFVRQKTLTLRLLRPILIRAEHNVLSQRVRLSAQRRCRSGRVRASVYSNAAKILSVCRFKTRADLRVARHSAQCRRQTTAHNIARDSIRITLFRVDPRTDESADSLVSDAALQRSSHSRRGFRQSF